MKTLTAEGLEQLVRLGWSKDDDLSFVENFTDARPGRVVIMHGNQAEVTWFPDDMSVTELLDLSGSLNLRPVAGDWVAVRPNELVAVGNRRTSLARPDPNGTDTQVLAANIDVVFIVMPIDRPLNLKAIERLLVMAWDSGANPVLVLTKADGCFDVDEALREAESVAMGVTIVVTSVVDGRGLEEIRSYLSPGSTVTMLGASGVGKTSLLNALEGSDEATFDVRADGQGRHTTTTRRLFQTTSGGVLLDVPGIRSLALLATDEGIAETFADISEYAEMCRFRDCSHDGDTGCAVQAAVDSGDLPARRLDSWRSIQRELAYNQRRNDPEAMAQERQKWKQMSKEVRNR